MEKVKLGEVCKLQGGFAFKSNKFQKNGIPIVRIGNIQENKVIIDKNVCYSEEFLVQHPEFKVVYGDVLIAMSGATVGKVGKYLESKDALLNQRVGKFINSEKIHRDYLYFLIQSPLFEKFILNNAFGCAQPNISNKKIEEFEFYNYSIDEQKKIIGKLNILQKMIDIRKRQIEELDELVKSQFVEMFGDVSINSKNYKMVKLSEIAEYWNGLTYKPSDVVKDGVIVLRSSNIQNGKLDFKDIVKVNCKIPDKKFVKDNDILMCSRNGSARLVGKVALINEMKEPMSFGAFMMIIRSKYYPYLLSYFETDAFRNQISTGVTTTINQITSNMMNRIELPLPSENEMNEFERIVKLIDKQKFKIQKSLNEMEKLQESLMNKYF